MANLASTACDYCRYPGASGRYQRADGDWAAVCLVCMDIIGSIAGKPGLEKAQLEWARELELMAKLKRELLYG